MRAVTVGAFVAILCITVIILGLLIKYSTVEYEHVRQTDITKSPPMGWSSWQVFQCSRDFNEQRVKGVIDRMVADGYVDAGYRYIVLGDCWQAGRDVNGKIIVDQERFPSGIADLAEYAHLKGMLIGIYTSAGRTTCMQKPGSYGYEQQDLETFRDWQVDYIELDWCGADYLVTAVVYQKWRAILNQLKYPVVLSVATPQTYSAYDSQSWLWGRTVADLWRVTPDVQDDWQEVLQVFDGASRYAPYQRSGEWNDPDMLMVGNNGMTFEEYRTHFGLWVTMAAPLQLSADLRMLSPELKAVVLNPHAIAINQDKLGLQGETVLSTGSIQVVSKPLIKQGSRAVLIINRGEEKAQFTLKPSQLGLLPLMYYHEIWPNKGQRRLLHQHTVTIQPHDSVLVMVRGIDVTVGLDASRPKLAAPVRSGNLTKQVAFDVYGIFEHDEAYQRGEGIGVRSNASMRYHLNARCRYLSANFEYIKSDGSSASLIAEAYLDGNRAWEAVVSATSSSARLEIPLKGARVLDLVTHTTERENSVVYGRWNQPIIECQD